MREVAWKKSYKRDGKIRRVNLTERKKIKMHRERRTEREKYCEIERVQTFKKLKEYCRNKARRQCRTLNKTNSD